MRSDVGFLRRRVKPAPTPEPATPAVTEDEPSATRPPTAGLSLAPARTAPRPATPTPPSASGLSLSPGPATPAATAAVRPESRPFPAPTIDDVRELGETDPVLRLNARESAVGSLIVSGAATAVWEDADRVTGSITAGGETAGTPVLTRGNRPLLGFDEADAIVTLRHVRELGRALLIPRGAHPLGVQIFDGSTVTTAPGDDSRMFVLYILRIDNLLELRAEPVDRTASDATILAQFGFTLTPYVSTRETRSR
ncbi:hypothetical protein K2F54_03980 [Cryobacterium sp. 1639]|uniref:hypothetical protein n=1 Tax=Cryobacterium inferilacus TaxID=2866629 RepID=UPI001C72DF21|nr:hypothetical protein [Cryobacterium sp. 1639]MBX0299131.1 hypothetical protein [Cryobacterium sp. 1639]